ncbi:hypothetical protein SPONN_2175 [uncultured Candidatus Thioglobus sp.]|nr:hypothetical protein SPONN_2175 [uncultured Candidatus Thioglobus sp.]
MKTLYCKSHTKPFGFCELMGFGLVRVYLLKNKYLSVPGSA